VASVCGTGLVISLTGMPPEGDWSGSAAAVAGGVKVVDGTGEVCSTVGAGAEGVATWGCVRQPEIMDTEKTTTASGTDPTYQVASERAKHRLPICTTVTASRGAANPERIPGLGTDVD
jgi:hypothetical protein